MPMFLIPALARSFSLSVKKVEIQSIHKIIGATDPVDFSQVVLTSVVGNTFRKLLLGLVRPCLADEDQFNQR